MTKLMQILEFLKSSLEGKGIYVIFIFILSWLDVFMLLLILIFQLLLYGFKVKYDNTEFGMAIKRKLDKKKKMDND